MRELLVVSLLAVPALWAQSSAGEAVFAKTCGTGYCHATRGVGGGAPRLAARGFSVAFIRDRVANGVAGTSMAAFGRTLSPVDLAGVIEYVASLNGLSVNGRSTVDRVTLTGEAEKGRVLFSEATRSFGRCSTCHQVNGIGIPVASPIASVPADVGALRNLATPRVSTAKVGGEAMPALIVARRAQEIVFYDLTSSPPVTRTLAPTAVESSDGSTWRHSSVLGSYGDAELTAVLRFLREVAQ